MTCHTEKQEKPQLEWEETTNANTEMNQMLELSEKGFKLAIVKMLH